MKRSLGIDIGNVIINHRLSNPDNKKIYEKQYSTIPPTSGAFDAIKILNDYFKRDVYLISKCTEWAQEKILIWLKDNDFYNKTNVNPVHVYFVRERREKDAVCIKLGVTHFIDDRLEVLSHMIESTPNLFLFQPDQKEIDEFKQFLPRVIVVNNWSEVITSIIS